MPTSSLAALDNLKQALAIAEQIQKLEADLQSVLSGSAVTTPSQTSKPSSIKASGKRTMSPATIAKMKASQQARWAKKKGAAVVTAVEEAVETAVKSTAKLAKKVKRKLSPEGRARIVAALKARHAAKKKAGK
jgi:hypothetical protein